MSAGRRGSIIVGVLLALVAVVLIDRSRRFPVGQGVTPDIECSMARRVLEHRDVARLTYLHLEFVGPCWPRHRRKGGSTCENAGFLVERKFSQVLLLPYF